MDITPIYELRTRFRAAAIAGTGLLSEDFRLKRAAEAIQPLEAASPVFAKIGSLTRSLFSAEPSEREGILLDAITLVDALLCTQGEVAVSGELQELPIRSRGSAVSNAPYSDVKMILDALTNSGGGRYSYLKEMHDTRPELFGDYRVKPAMVQALGASYAELADDVEKWLTEMDESILPLLQKGFDPKGKKEMLRRVKVIDSIAGAGANDFYRQQLPDAEKEIRQALIYALRNSPENRELLLSLVKTEKGNAKKMAYCALACQEGEEAEESIVKLMEKNLGDGLTALSASETDWASELVQKGICELTAKFEDRIKSGKNFLADHAKELTEDMSLLNCYLWALQGKNPKVVCDCVRKVAALAQDPALQNLRLTMDLPHGNYNSKTKGSTMANMLGGVLQDYVTTHPNEEVFSLAVELYQTSCKTSAGKDYFAAALLAKLFSEADCSGWLREELAREKHSPLSEQLPLILETLCWSEERKNWILQKWCYCPAFDCRLRYLRELRQSVRGDFVQVLMDSGRMERVLGNCIPAGDEEYEQTVMDYYYRQALRGNAEFYCMAQLRNHNYPKCEGLAVQYVKRKSQLSMWELKGLLNNLPGSSEAKRTEGREVLKLIKKGFLGRSKVTNLNMEEMEMLVESL